MQHIRSRFAKV